MAKSAYEAVNDEIEQNEARQRELRMKITRLEKSIENVLDTSAEDIENGVAQVKQLREEISDTEIVLEILERRRKPLTALRMQYRGER